VRPLPQRRQIEGHGEEHVTFRVHQMSGWKVPRVTSSPDGLPLPGLEGLNDNLSVFPPRPDGVPPRVQEMLAVRKHLRAVRALAWVNREHRFGRATIRRDSPNATFGGIENAPVSLPTRTEDIGDLRDNDGRAAGNRDAPQFSNLIPIADGSAVG
jgi:hypothetical protein